MTKSDIIIELKTQKIVVVVRGKTKEEGLKASIACIKGGIKAIEVAYTNQYAGEIIKELNHLYQDDASVCIGAGTVLDAVTARDATARICNLYSIPYIPGCMTLTEITTALEAGSEIIKLFPGSALSPKYISAVKAPIPQVAIMVTGGVNLDNVSDWFSAGADAIGIGGEFNKLASRGNYEAITTIAKQYTALK